MPVESDTGKISVEADISFESYLVHEIYEASSRDQLEKKLHDELAKFTLGRIDWRKIRVRIVF
jgi:hypothetical protein